MKSYRIGNHLLGVAWMLLLGSAPAISAPEQSAAITPHFKDVSLRDAITAIGAITGQRIDFDANAARYPAVTVLTEIAMSPDAYKRTMIEVSRVNGVAIHEDDGKLWVSQVRVLGDQELLATKVVSFAKSNSTTLQAKIRPLLTKRGSILEIAQDRMLLIFDTPGNISKIDGALKE